MDDALYRFWFWESMLYLLVKVAECKSPLHLPNAGAFDFWVAFGNFVCFCFFRVPRDPNGRGSVSFRAYLCPSVIVIISLS